MVRAGCVFVAGIHPSRSWTSGSFESVRWNACVHRLDLGLCSYPKEFWGSGVWTHVNSKGKIPSTGKCPQSSIEPATLWQRAQALPAELFRPLNRICFIYWLRPLTDEGGEETGVLREHPCRWASEISCQGSRALSWLYLLLQLPLETVALR